MTSSLLYLVWLTCNTSFSPSVKKLLERFTPEELYRFDRDDYLSLGMSEKSSEQLSDKSLVRAEKIINICQWRDITPIPFTDPLYPECIRGKSDMPVILYAKGDVGVLNRGFRIGFVGTRNTTPNGQQFAYRTALELLENDALIISGGASGIDSVGLITALECKKPSVAVLGCDIDKYYPAKNYALFEHIVSNGLVLSEYPPQTNARYFPVRNRIIAGLSQRLLVLEAPEKSGALITANYASDYGVPVLAPRLDGESFEGCRSLLERGASELDGWQSVLSAEGKARLKKPKKASPRVKADKIPEIKKKSFAVYSDPVLNHVCECIRAGRDTPEKMLDGYSINAILSALTQLEIEGAVISQPGNRYILNN